MDYLCFSSGAIKIIFRPLPPGRMGIEIDFPLGTPGGHYIYVVSHFYNIHKILKFKIFLLYSHKI